MGRSGHKFHQFLAAEQNLKWRTGTIQLLINLKNNMVKISLKNLSLKWRFTLFKIKMWLTNVLKIKILVLILNPTIHLLFLLKMKTWTKIKT